MNNPKILLVEDDLNLGQILNEYLNVKGYDTILARDGEEGYKSFDKGKFDLCIFDVMMPKLDGFSLAEKVRKSDADIPIIFVTAKSMKEDAINGFKAGADDYITKPFSMEELLLRIKAILRRTLKQEEENNQEKFQIGNFSFDHSSQKLVLDGNEQKLTSKESALLQMLCLHKNQVMDRSKALKKIWLDDNYFNSRSMDVYITKLRKYLKPDENLQILNVHGQGFKLIELQK
ncbi:response regulator transcription factor [Flammeovirgaceae bacterium SG7u.111]|nr:response regulator transcription factor [Flammeovirgaceae bacterium SG7u.132]WPO34639.1 response regulator transcription factor [Flammeovirgaceae bacterium SG7u.111]